MHEVLYIYSRDDLRRLKAKLTACRWSLGRSLKNKNLNLTNIKCSKHISKLT